MPEGVFAYSNTHPKYPNLSDTKTTAILKYRKDLRCALSLNHCYQFGDKNQNANLKVEGTDGVAFITLGSTVNYPHFEKDKFEINPNSLKRLENSVEFSFFHGRDQIDHITNQVKLYSNQSVGLGKLLQKSNLQSIFRRFKRTEELTS